MIKKILMTIILLCVVGAGGYFAMTIDQLQFESICDKTHKRYSNLCENVGKDAWNQQSVLQINQKNYGRILGVSWRKKGSIISSRIHKQKRYSEKNAYYYIIGDPQKPDSQFLRASDETTPRDPGYVPPPMQGY